MKVFIISLFLVIFSFKYAYAQSIDVWVISESSKIKRDLSHFSQSSEAKCQSIDSAEALDKFRWSMKSDFDQLMKSWQRMSVLNISATEDERYKLSFQFFPDKKGRIKKKLFQVMSAGKAINEQSIEQIPFYATGISGLEVLLYDQEEGFMAAILDHPRVYCSLLNHIPKYLENKQKGFESSWVVYKNKNSENEIIADLLNSILFSLEDVKKNKLGRPIHLDSKKVFKKRFESYRSLNSLLNIENNLIAQKEIIDIVFYPLLRKKNDKSMMSTIDNGYKKTGLILESFSRPFFELQADTPDYENSKKLIGNVTTLIGVVKGQLAPKLEIPLHFNGADGD